MSKTYSAGIVTAYGAAKRAGYTGTYEDFCRQQAGYAESAATVEQAKTDAINAKNDAVTAKNTAVSAKDDAVSAKNDAVSAKNTATTKAQEASQSATSAGQSATSAGQSATSAEASARASAQSADNAEQSAQSVSGSLAQIQTNKEDIDTLKADLDDNVNDLKSAINDTNATVDSYLVHSNVLYKQDSFSVGEAGQTYQQKVFYTLNKTFAVNDSYTFECDSIVGNTTTAIRFKVMHGTTQIRTETSSKQTPELVQVTIDQSDVTSGADSIVFFVYASTSTPQTQPCVLTNPVVYEGLTHSEQISYADNFTNEVNGLLSAPLQLIQTGNIHPSAIWENGQIDVNGQDTTGNYNRRTKGYISIEDYDFVAHLTKPSSASLTLYLYEYDSSKGYLGRTIRSLTGDLTIQNSSCKFVRLFTYSESVAQGEQESYVTLTVINPESLHDISQNVSKKLGTQDYNSKLHAFDLLDSSVLYRIDEIQIGATKNNDSGNTTYIFKNIVVSEKIGCIWLRVKEISNARLNSVLVYFYNSKTTQTGSTLISSVQLDDGLAKYGAMLTCPVGTLSVRVSLYPSTSGGLTDQYATYKDVIVGVTNYRINPMDLIQKKGKPVPFYYFQNDYLKNKISTIRQAITASNGNYDAFVFCTDQHWKLNAKNSPALIRYLSEELNIKRLFMGGDYADGINMDALKAYKEPSDYSVYNTIGNHEYGNFFEEDGVQTAQTIDGNDIWLYLDGGMTDAVIGNAERGYYYVDNPMQKMRYIVLSVYDEIGGTATFTFETAQKEWLQDMALNMPEGYTAVIFAHFLCGFDYDTGAVTVALNSDIESVVDGYNGNGVIACMLAGHTHIDGTTTTTGGIPIFVTTCDKYYPWIQNETDMEPWLTANRHLGTITEQAFDVVVIDKTNKKVSLVRIGAPADNGASQKLEERIQNYGT